MSDSTIQTSTLFSSLNARIEKDNLIGDLLQDLRNELELERAIEVGITASNMNALEPSPISNFETSSISSFV